MAVGVAVVVTVVGGGVLGAPVGAMVTEVAVGAAVGIVVLVGLEVGICVGAVDAVVAMVEHMKVKDVTAVPVTDLIPLARLPLAHSTGTGVIATVLVPYGPSLTEVVHSVNVSWVTKEFERPKLYEQYPTELLEPSPLMAVLRESEGRPVFTFLTAPSEHWTELIP